MTIVICTRDVDYGAGQQTIIELSELIKNKKIHKIIIISPKKIRSISSNKIEYIIIKNVGKYFITKEPIFALQCGLVLKNLFKNRIVDYVYTQSNIVVFNKPKKVIIFSKFHNFHLGIASKQPLTVVGIISRIVHYIYSIFDIVTMLRSNRVFFVSEKTLNLAKKVFPFFQNRYFYEMNSVKLSKFTYKKTNKILINNKNYIKDNKYYYILFVGRLEEMKGIIELIKTIKTINEPSIKLIIVGDGPLRNQVIKEKFVIYAGRLKNELISRYYNFANLFVLASYYENGPMTIFEAILCETLIVARDVGDINKFVDPRFLYPPDEGEKLKELMLSCKNMALKDITKITVANKERLLKNMKSLHYDSKF